MDNIIRKLEDLESCLEDFDKALRDSLLNGLETVQINELKQQITELKDELGEECIELLKFIRKKDHLITRNEFGEIHFNTNINKDVSESEFYKYFKSKI